VRFAAYTGKQRIRVIGPQQSPARALELIKDEAPALALLDVNLGDTTSFALADALTARECKVVLRNRPLPLLDFEIQPPSRVVEKPFLPDELLATVKNELEACQPPAKRAFA
jgi:DNA-binding response OmpR family regulator